jgi:hypothetical protein
MAARAVEDNDGIGSNLEGCPSLLFREDGVEISTEMVAEEKEISETADGWRVNGALVVYGKLVAREIGVNAGTGRDGEAVAFRVRDGASRTVKVLKYVVDDRGG